MRSAMVAKVSRTSSLVETFAPPTMAVMGRAGALKARSNASSSPASNGPAQATGANFATPWVEACARWAVANASMT